MKKNTLIALMGIAILMAFTGCKKEDKQPEAAAPAETQVQEVQQEAVVLTTSSARPEVENKKGTVVDIVNADFNDGDNWDIIGDGAECDVVEGVGRNGGNALLVSQTETYGGTYIDATLNFGRGKSYYVEGWFKDAGSTTSKAKIANISFTAVSGTMELTAASIGKEYYDWDSDFPYEIGPYDGELSVDGEPFDMEDAETGLPFDENEWTKVSAFIDATELNRMIDETGCSRFYIQFFAGSYPEQTGYCYYLDDIVVKDLNDEQELGPLYEEPEEEEEDDE
ncbi:MAG: hypothetical protein KBT02_01710 [Treponema sp.]|nr:hypothetical protein [Candidatus Treponema caballi]